MWVPDITDIPGPKYLSISRALARDVELGRLRAGDRLPPQRDLAEALGVDLGTVTRGYAEARRLGLIGAEGRRGSFVRDPALAVISAEVPPFETGMNLPPIPMRSSLAARYAAALQAVLEGPSAANRLQYQPAGGAPVDRQAGATWLNARGIAASEDMVLVTSGAQTALHAIARAALEEGDGICTGAFTYPGWLAIARSRGLRIITVASDSEGLDPEAIERACAEGKVRGLYLVPTNDNPTTATMSVERRKAIAMVARRNELTIIEDDAYGLLSTSPLQPVAAFAPERTWHVTSLSKIISPALRVAYLRAPSLRDAWRVAADLHETTIMAPPLNSAVATRWIDNGDWKTLVSEVLAECAARRAIVRDLLPPEMYRASADGYHLWIPLAAEIGPSELVTALAPTGLSAVAGDMFAAQQGGAPPAVRVSIGGSLDHERLARALRLLEALLHDRRGRMSPMI